MFKRNWKRTFLNVLDVLKLNITIFCFKGLEIKSFWPSSFLKFVCKMRYSRGLAREFLMSMLHLHAPSACLDATPLFFILSINILVPQMFCAARRKFPVCHQYMSQFESLTLQFMIEIQVNTHEKSFYLITKFKTEKPNCIYICQNY